MPYCSNYSRNQVRNTGRGSCSPCAEFHQDACDTCIKKRKDPLSQFPLAMAYVPWQEWREICDLEKALCQGTIFQELNLEFLGRKGGQMR